MDATFESPAAEVARLRRCLNDLVSIIALPGVWAGDEPPQIVSTLLEALLGMLNLDFAYARLDDSDSGSPIEILRVARPLEEPVRPREMGLVLDRSLGGTPLQWPARARISIAGSHMAVARARLGLHGEIGVVVAGSSRDGFPTQTEGLLLDVAANQAAIGLQQARLLSEQKRISRELDLRVAQRTSELAAANAVLQKEVAERRRTEEALRANELNFQLTVDSIPGMVHTMTASGGVEFVNHQILDFFGKTIAELNDWETLLHPDDRARIVEQWTHSIATGEPYDAEHRVLRADGTYRWLHSRGLPLRDFNGNIVRWYNLLTDIDERKRAEDALRASALNLRQMTETIPEMLWSAAPDGTIDYCNSRFLNYTGFSAEEVMGDGWQKTIHPDDAARVAPVWMSCVATGAPYRVEVRTYHAADRTYRLCTVAALPLRDEHGHILKWHGTIVDMHDWKQAQEELRNTQATLAHVTRVMTMGELTASIAHEVNQPLSGIVTNASTCLRMLAADPPDIAGARETARRTVRDGNRASEVIERLRALFSKKDVTAEPVDLNDAIREVIALSLSGLHKNEVTLQSELANDLPLITGDRVQLQQVVLNLMMNASDAMSAVKDRPRQLLIRTDQDEDDHVRVTVTDTGVGFGPQEMDRLFEAFYTTKSTGMGMGLSVSRSIIERHHGRLWAAPNEGPGATFLFRIPRLPATPSPGSARV